MTNAASPVRDVRSSASTGEADPTDVHVHIVGNGRSGTGCWLNLRGYHRWLAAYMLRHLGLPAAALEGDLDELYVRRLLEFVATSSLKRVIILAHENVYDDRGDVMEGIGGFYVPNEHVLRLAHEHPCFRAAVSIHPARRDAMRELDRAIEGGAVMMKCLPNCQNIDCRRPEYRPFWKRMAEAGMILLAHTGGELSVPVVRREFQDPRYLKEPLDCGVTVIAAHVATSSGVGDVNYLPVLADLCREYPRLYCDNSALCSPLRSRHLRACFQSPLIDRMIHGSDLPIPVSGLWLWLRRLISWRDYRRSQGVRNILERDAMLKRSLGFSEETFLRLSGLLKQQAS